MSTHTPTAARRGRPTAAQLRARDRRRTRRRRALLTVLCLAVIGVAGIVVVGAINTAVDHIRNPSHLPLEHASIIREQAAAKGLDPALIAGVIYTESRFDPRTSPAGAEGLMQLTPDTATYIAGKSGGTAFTVADLATPKVNIAYGSWYLRYLLQRYDGDTQLALAAYNAGEGNVDKWVASARADGREFRLSDIRFPETRAYVDNVLARQKEYRAQYPAQLDR